MLLFDESTLVNDLIYVSLVNVILLDLSNVNDTSPSLLLLIVPLNIEPLDNEYMKSLCDAVSQTGLKCQIGG